MAEPSPELFECVQRLRSIVEKQTRLLDEIIAVLVGHEAAESIRGSAKGIEEEMAQALMPILQALGSSSHTVVRLSDRTGLHTRDCMVISRSVVEAGINACYLMAEGPSAAERALRHARQKSFRDLDRRSAVSESVIQLAFEGTPNPDTIPGLAENIQEFTARSGREKGWTDLSVDERIQISGKRFGNRVLNLLHFARFAVYRHSSEIIHGTLFGALFFLGFSSPSERKKTVSDAAEHIAQQHMLLLFAIINTISAVVDAFHRVYGFQRAHDESRTLYAEVARIPYFAENPDNAVPSE